jgi:hypothetical protein
MEHLPFIALETWPFSLPLFFCALVVFRDRSAWRWLWAAIIAFPLLLSFPGSEPNFALWGAVLGTVGFLLGALFGLLFRRELVTAGPQTKQGTKSISPVLILLGILSSWWPLGLVLFVLLRKG